MAFKKKNFLLLSHINLQYVKDTFPPFPFRTLLEKSYLETVKSGSGFI